MRTPMVVERQGPMECALSTMAALTGRTLAEVRAIAVKEQASMGLAFHYTPVLERIATVVGGESLVELLALPGSTTLTGSSVRRLSSCTRKLPAEGRGVVFFWNKGVRRFAHVCPWQDGLLYDPGAPGRGQTLAEFRAASPNMLLGHVTVERSPRKGGE